MAYSKVILNNTTLIDVTDTTAVAEDVAQSKYFYLASGVKTEGTASGGGGASNIVTGTFTTPSTNGIDTLETISYTGNGYPVMAYFIVDGGLYDPNTSWYSLIQQYAVGMWSMNKQIFSTTPVYNGSSDSDKCNLNYIYKSTTSSATTYGVMGNVSIYNFTDQVFSQGASGTSGKLIRFPSATSFRYYTISTSGGYGFAPSTTYRYWIVYSE